MPRIHVREFTVPESAIDVNRHVNNLEYLRWMQDVAVEHSAARGWDRARYLAARVVWVVRSHAIEYLRPAFAGDALRLATWVADLRPRSSLRKYLFFRAADDHVVARAETVWVLVNAQTGRACALPAELRDSFEVVPDDEEVLRRLRGSREPVADGKSDEA
jgi:acyl-CoA thioester hydrolase